MKVTIIEAGLVPERVGGAFGDYPEMTAALLRQADPVLDFETVSVVTGAVLPDPGHLEAILITGSPASVYDNAPWITPLLQFIRDAADAGVPQVGICFGHQAIAQALGGRVDKAPAGWGVGLHTYKVVKDMPWMATAPRGEVSIAVSHQDQVLAPPEGATIFASSEFTPYAGLSFAGTPAISVQCHPEFSTDYSAALYESRKGRPLTDAQVKDAVTSLAGQVDNEILAQWIVSFYRQSALVAASASSAGAPAL